MRKKGGKVNMHYDIVALPKDQWKGTAIPLSTRSDSYYDFEMSPLTSEGCTVSIVRKPAAPVKCWPALKYAPRSGRTGSWLQSYG